MARLNDKNSSCIIQTAGQMVEYIEKTGFLPFFKNDIPGFSVEEHTLPGDWQGGTSQAGVWEWRSSVVRSGKAVYGNFFDGKEGFISKKWFPCFANYRRDGYDFDALWNDGKADRKSKKIMDLFDANTELCFLEITKFAGLGGVGKKNLEGIVIGLQMQSYLCVRDFGVEKGRQAKESGLSAAVYACPESFWGYDYVTSAYGEMPEESYQRMAGHFSKMFPGISERKVCHMLGSVEAAAAYVKAELPRYPENLLKAVDLYAHAGIELDCANLSADQMAGLEYAIGRLNESEQEILRLRYREGRTYRAIGERKEISGTRACQLHARALRKLRAPSWHVWYAEGFAGHSTRREEKAARLRQSIQERAGLKIAGK